MTIAATAVLVGGTPWMAAPARAGERRGAPANEIVADATGQAMAVAENTSVQSKVARAGGSEASAGAALLADSGDDPDAHPERLLALFVDSAATSPASGDELDLVLRQRQVFSDLRTLEDRINNSLRPTANAVARYSSQSDHLDIRQAEISQDLFFSQGLSQWRLGLMTTAYDPRDGDTIKQYAEGVMGNQRLSDLVALTGEFWLNQLRGAGLHREKMTYNAFVTLRPSDAIRVDLNTSRRLFDNVRSLRLGLAATSYGGSLDFTPADDLRLTARGSYGRYSDGNRRWQEEVEGVWRATSRPIIELGVNATNFHFSLLLDNGYFNPREYYAATGLFRLRTTAMREKLTLEFVGAAGVEDADPGGTKPLVKGSFQFAYELAPRLSFDGELAHFSSRQSTSSGFSRTTAQLGIHFRF